MRDHIAEWLKVYLVQLLDLLLTSYVMLGKLLNLSEAHFPPSIGRKGARDDGRKGSWFNGGNVCLMIGYLSGKLGIWAGR